MAKRPRWLVLSALGVLLVPSPARASATVAVIDAALDDASVIVTDDAGPPPPPDDAGSPPPPDDAAAAPPDDAAVTGAPDAATTGSDASIPASSRDASSPTAPDPGTAVDSGQGGVSGVTPFAPGVHPFDPGDPGTSESCSATAGAVSELPSPFVLGLVGSLVFAFRLRRLRSKARREAQK